MKCWICGKEATVTRNLKTVHMYNGERWYDEDIPNQFQRNYCRECYDKHLQENAEENKEYIRLRHKRMFEKAVSQLEHQQIDFEEYEEAIKAVEEYNLEHLDKFDSSYEIMAAIELIKNEIYIKPQFKVGRLQVDFLIPDYHIVLEIDGERHKYSKTKDAWRDIEIRNKLGEDWEIVRIGTSNLDKDISKLVPAIEKVLEFREQHTH